jgi:hypothetical protein
MQTQDHTTGRSYVWCARVRYVVEEPCARVETLIHTAQNDPTVRPSGFVYLSDVCDHRKVALSVAHITSFGPLNDAVT